MNNQVNVNITKIIMVLFNGLLQIQELKSNATYYIRNMNTMGNTSNELSSLAMVVYGHKISSAPKGKGRSLWSDIHLRALESTLPVLS